MVLQCAIIDDEPLARECIANYIQEIDFLTLVGSGNNPLELTKIQENHHLDLVFLDIQMPMMNGIEYLKISPTNLMFILTTAYPNYALEGFELDVMDYLLKPITFNRFFKAAKKAWEHSLLLQGQEKTSTILNANIQDYFFVKCDNTYEKIFIQEILFVEAMQNYVSFHTIDGKKRLALLSLKNVEETLNSNTFLRVHKSFIVSIAKIDSISDNKIHIASSKIPIGRNYKTVAMEKILNHKIWKK